MIITYTDTVENKYGKYFLASEAPGDEPTEASDEGIIKRNMKIISVAPTRGRKKDFMQDITPEVDETIPDENLEEPVEDTGVQEPPMEDNTENPGTVDQEEPVEDDNVEDQPAKSPEQNTEEPVQDNPPEENEVITPDDNKEGEPDFMADDGTEDQLVNDVNATNQEINNDQQVNNPEGAPQPDNGEEIQPEGQEGEPDFMADDGGGEDDGQGAPPEGGEQQPEEGQQHGGPKPGLEYDSTRKYNLYKNYISLYNAINNYITKLDANLNDDIRQNQLLRTASNKLVEVEELCFDYMTMKFEASTYIQSLIFYQNLVVEVQMIFNLLGKMQKNLKK